MVRMDWPCVEPELKDNRKNLRRKALKHECCNNGSVSSSASSMRREETTKSMNEIIASRKDRLVFTSLSDSVESERAAVDDWNVSIQELPVN